MMGRPVVSDLYPFTHGYVKPGFEKVREQFQAYYDEGVDTAS